jgi:hypothetical protein
LRLLAQVIQIMLKQKTKLDNNEYTSGERHVGLLVKPVLNIEKHIGYIHGTDFVYVTSPILQVLTSCLFGIVLNNCVVRSAYSLSEI